MEYTEHFLRWTEQLRGTPMAQELANLSEEEKQDRFGSFLKFGTAGMRGKMGAGINRLNLFTVRRAARGLAEFICKRHAEEQGILIAYDSRKDSGLFAKETALVLAANGVRAFLFDTLQSVPLLSFGIRELGCAGGVVITASHNKKIYNGFKVYGADGGQVDVEDAREITACIDGYEEYFSIRTMEESAALEQGLLRYVGAELDEKYYAAFLRHCAPEPSLKEALGQLRIVYTPLYGTGRRHVQRLMKEIGVTGLIPVEEHLQPNGDFPGLSAPNPEFYDVYALPEQYAQREQADFIVATDPDCDRMGTVVRREDGSFVQLTGNQIGCLLMDYVLRCKRDRLKDGFAVMSLVSTRMAVRIAEHYGIELREVLPGFRFASEQIRITKDKHFLFGFEDSFGYLEDDFVRDKDGAMSAVYLAMAAAWHRTQGRTLYQAAQWLYEQYGYALEEMQAITIEGLGGLQRIADFTDELRAHPLHELGGVPITQSLDLRGGYRNLPPSNIMIYDLQDGSRVMFRPSGTEPKLKIYYFVGDAVREAAERKLGTLKQGAERLLRQYQMI